MPVITGHSGAPMGPHTKEGYVTVDHRLADIRTAMYLPEELNSRRYEVGNSQDV